MVFQRVLRPIGTSCLFLACTSFCPGPMLVYGHACQHSELMLSVRAQHRDKEPFRRRIAAPPLSMPQGSACSQERVQDKSKVRSCPMKLISRPPRPLSVRETKRKNDGLVIKKVHGWSKIIAISVIMMSCLLALFDRASAHAAATQPASGHHKGPGRASQVSQTRT